MPRWSQWPKARHDQVRRKQLPLHFVATGSSLRQIGSGARESMAGRFERLTMAPWGAQDLIDLVAVPKTVASEKIVTCGGYPGAVPFWNDRERWNRYLRDAIIEPAIGRDLLQLEQVRRPALRKQVFALAAAHPAEILSLEKIAGSLAEKGTLETSAHFLEVLQPTLLVATLKNHVGDEIRRRRAPPKRVVLNNPFWPAAVRPRLRRLSPVRRNGAVAGERVPRSYRQLRAGALRLARGAVGSGRGGHGFMGSMAGGGVSPVRLATAIWVGSLRSPGKFPPSSRSCSAIPAARTSPKPPVSPPDPGRPFC